MTQTRRIITNLRGQVSSTTNDEKIFDFRISFYIYQIRALLKPLRRNKTNASYCQGTKILPIRARCWICSEMSWNTVIDERQIELNCLHSSANLKQGAHIQQPTAGPVLHACVQPYRAVSGSHRQLFHPYWGPPAWKGLWINKRWKPTSQKPLIVEVSAKEFIKRNLHTTNVGAVGWEPHSSSTTTSTGKVDHELPVN